MRGRSLLLLAVLAVAAGLTVVGCGGEDEVSPVPETVTGTLPTETEPTETTPTETEPTQTETETTETETTETEPPAEGDPEAGKSIFVANCGACHTLADAGTTGTVGPNLDDSQPSVELAIDRVTNGRGAMPSFSASLSEQQIADVSAYVAQASGG